MHHLTLSLLPGIFTCFRLPTPRPYDSAPPLPPLSSLTPHTFLSITPTELTIIAPLHLALSSTHMGPLRLLRLEGTFDSTATGILASLTAPLAAARCFILAQSTFDTDYLLIREDQLTPALNALRNAGNTINES